MKARKTATSDDVLILRSDQRRPEAMIREMKAKARSLKAKIAKKMEATKAAGGKEDTVHVLYITLSYNIDDVHRLVTEARKIG